MAKFERSSDDFWPGAAGATVPRPGTITVLIAEDDWYWGSAVNLALDMADDIIVLGTARTGERALQAALEGKPDVVLIDLVMPAQPGARPSTADGLKLTKELLARDPEARIIAVSVTRDDSDIIDALGAGAKGFLVKRELTRPDQLIDAVRLVNGGGTALSDRALDVVVNGTQRDDADTSAKKDMPVLSMRETEVLRGIVCGRSNRAIADEIGVTEQVVKNNVRQILRKLGAPNRTAAALIAQLEGMV